MWGEVRRCGKVEREGERCGKVRRNVEREGKRYVDREVERH